jgi:dTDP-4-dehydrorhamnose reductase
MRIVVLGKNGQLGRALQRELERCGLVIAVGRESADLEDPKQLRRYLRTISPDLIVNAAAYTNVERAESEPRRAKIINGVAPGIIAEEALRAQAILFHFSTDYVFDGAKREPYLERDTTAPLNTYGETKLLGEEAIEEVGGAYLIFRTSWVFSEHGENFLQKILRRAQVKKELAVVNDQVGVPTSASALAQATRGVLQKLQRDANYRGMRLYTAARKASGIYNAVCEGHGSWHDFAEAIVEFARTTALGNGLRVERVVPISSDQFPTKAKRPAYSVLAREKLQARFKIELPHWRSCMEQSLLGMTHG